MNTTATPTIPKTLGAFVWYFLKDHKIVLVVFFIVNIFWALEMSLSPYLLKLIIDGATTQAQNKALLVSTIIVPAVLYALMSLFVNVIFRVYDYACIRLYPALRSEATAYMFSYLSKHSRSFFQQRFAGNLSNKIMDMAHSIEPIVRIPSEVFISRAIMIIVATFMLLLVSPIFSLVLFIWSIAYVSFTYFLSKRAENLSMLLSEASSILSGGIVDSVSNIFSAKIFSNLGYETSRLKKLIATCVQQDRALLWYMLKTYCVQGLLLTALVSLMLYLLIYGRLHDNVTVGDFAFVLGVTVAIAQNIFNIGQEMTNFAKEAGRCRQALSIIIEPHEIVDVTKAKRLNVTRGEICFKNVNFAYSGTKPLFQDLNVVMKPAEKVGLVGFSGSGKSSFVSLILRLYDIQSGAILIDNQDIKTIQKHSLREQITMIPQEPDLFHRTILDNIRYGRLTASDEEVILASKKSHCHEFIEQLPQGYNSLVGERGVKLSGGQRQRIAIARAILKNSPILILDEATSSLDSITESYIQDSIENMIVGKTTIVIAHRLSTLLKMDRILVFTEGNIIEDGTLASLQASKGYFAKLWDMQVNGFIPDTEMDTT